MAARMTPSGTVPDGLGPGAHIALPGDHSDALRLRRAGMEMRDTILVLSGGCVATVLLFRVPPDGTVAANTLARGQGGLNIDACRLPAQDADLGAVQRQKADSAGVRGIGGSGFRQHHEQAMYNPAGRWPPNLLIVHGSGCRRNGMRKVRASHDTTGVWGRAGVERVYEGGWERDPQALRPGYTSGDGTEEVEAWACRGGCLAPGMGSAGRFFPQFDGAEGMLDWLHRLTGG